MLSMSFALPSGSPGMRTLSASRSIWYNELVNSGSGNSLRKSFRTPENIIKENNVYHNQLHKMKCRQHLLDILVFDSDY